LLLTVTISESNIKRGLRGAHGLDAFALAVSEAIVNQMKQKRGSFKVMATNRDILFINGVMFDIPEPVQEFIRRSDFNGTLYPITFQLEVAEDVFIEGKGRK
jgi:hypothetical protein